MVILIIASQNLSKLIYNKLRFYLKTSLKEMIIILEIQ